MAEPLPPSEVKGLWFTVGRRYVLEGFGQEALDAVVANMGPEHGGILSSALPSEWYEEETLRRMLVACNTVLAKENPDEFVHVTEEASLVAIHHFFRALLRLVPPGVMLRKIPTMWNIMRRGPGRVAVQTSADAGIVRYSRFPYFDDVLYRRMTKGAIRALMRLCGTPASVELGPHTSDSLTVEVRWG
ncbi:MAG TPA: hypothetical protein VF765_01100 [Polyangiaceae bacterium]